MCIVGSMFPCDTCITGVDLPGFHQMFSEVITSGHQLMNVDPRPRLMAGGCS